MREAEQELRESTPEEVEAAEAQGWKNDQEHPNFKEAWQFVEDGKKIAPLTAKRNAKLEAEMSAMRQTMDELRGDFIKQRIDGEKAGYEKAKRELEARKAEAYENEDLDELRKIDREEKQLKPPEEPKPAPVKKVNTDFVAWREDNDWYGDTNDETNLEMTLYADSIGDMVAQGMQGKSLGEVYKEVERRVKARFPEKFGKKEPGVSTVETGGKKAPKANGKQNWAALPKDVRTEVEQRGDIARYFGGDKDAYAKKYFEVIGG